MFASVEAMLKTHGLDGSERALAHNGYSGSRISRIEQGSRAYVLKRLARAENWLMRLTGDERCREAVFAASRLPAMLPADIRTPYIASARDGDGFAILMHDISGLLFPDDGTISPDTMGLFLQRVAELHAWGWARDFNDVDIPWCPLDGHLTLVSPSNGRLLRDEGLDIGAAIVDGWDAFEGAAPTAAVDLIRRLHANPEPLRRALRGMPQTLLHHDLKVANAGIDGPTLWLIDWSEITLGPVALDLAWLLAVNSSRLPWSLDETAGRYRRQLSAALGPRWTVAMWDEQLAAAKLCGLVMFGWGKGDDAAELRWWCDGALESVRTLGL